MKRITLTPTEICLMEVISEPRFSAFEKLALIDDYLPKITKEGARYLYAHLEFVTILDIYLSEL